MLEEVAFVDRAERSFFEGQVLRVGHDICSGSNDEIQSDIAEPIVSATEVQQQSTTVFPHPGRLPKMSVCVSESKMLAKGFESRHH